MGGGSRAGYSGPPLALGLGNLGVGDVNLLSPSEALVWLQQLRTGLDVREVGVGGVINLGRAGRGGATHTYQLGMFGLSLCVHS